VHARSTSAPSAPDERVRLGENRRRAWRRGGRATTTRPRPTSSVHTGSVREKAQERVFHDLGACGSSSASARHRESRRRLRGEPGRRGDRGARAVRDSCSAADLHRLPSSSRRACQRRRRRSTSPSRDREVRTGCRGRAAGPTAFVSIMEGCSSTAASASCPTPAREVSRPLDDVLAEVAELAQQGVQEVTLLGQNVNAGAAARTRRGRDFARCSNTSRRFRHRAPALHDSHPGIHPAPHRRPCRLPQLASTCTAGAVGLDRVLMAMKRGYTRSSTGSSCAGCALPPDVSISSTSSSFSRRDRGRLRGHPAARRRRRLRRELQLPLQPAPARRRALTDDTRTSEARPPAAPAVRLEARQQAITPPWSAPCSACSSRGVAQGSGRARRRTSNNAW